MIWSILTIELLEDTLDGAGATAAGHCDVEFVVVFGHVCCWNVRVDRRLITLDVVGEGTSVGLRGGDVV